MNRKILFILPAALVIAALLVAANGPARAQGSAEVTAIRGVIASQLAAFGRDDGPGAFAFASPTIRAKFQTPEIFMDMVRRHYAPVYRPSEVSFQDLHAGPRGPVQEVLLVGPDGQVVIALYFMEQQPDASWKINGVQLVKAPDQIS
ncbi:MAG: DUF4864 domain-containing protein [Kiloniellales bacterium]|nr:DUF4864 domain-containing protein [Kiloniellales bacterium]